MAASNAVTTCDDIATEVPGRHIHMTAAAKEASCLPTGLIVWVEDGDCPGLCVGDGEDGQFIVTGDVFCEMLELAVAEVINPTP